MYSGTKNMIGFMTENKKPESIFFFGRLHSPVLDAAAGNGIRKGGDAIV